ncbi:MAG: hypothetical protein FJ144_23210 [Deltaproteobacteria bacterium]|nr:hypothetical protein [Deltaproteobacteria bacterium]
MSGRKAATLFSSHAEDVAASTQRRRERGLLAAAALGEAHLHVAALAGDVLSLGAFHRALDDVEREAVWRRHTGGRATAAGRGFVVVTLALPHRSALVDADRLALKPEQVMNRCVRGLLDALRRLGVDPVYPGLDAVTHARRTLALLSFVEAEGGTTLFQAVLAVRATFADTARLLDRLDPAGRVPSFLLGAEEVICVEEVLGPTLLPELEPATFAAHVAAGCLNAFGTTSTGLDPEVTDVLASAYESEPDPLRLPASRGHGAHASGRLGPIEALALVEGGRVRAVSLAGDFLAPAGFVDDLSAALAGVTAEAEAIAAAVSRFLDGDAHYLLGLLPAELADVIARAAAEASA